MTHPGETPTAPPAAPALRITAEARPVVSYALLQRGAPVVERIRIDHQGSRPLAGVQVHASLSGDAARWSATLAQLEPGQHCELTDVRLEPDPASLAKRTEREHAHLVIQARDPAGVPLAEHRLPVDLLPADHWPGVSVLPEILAAFVTPNHPALEPLLSQGSDHLAQATGESALDGYQSKNPTRAAQIAEACFLALHKQDLRYVSPPASFEQHGQRVRFADRVLDAKQGACLDLALLLAGLWEQAGLHPLILIADGHALPAFWTTDQRFPDAALDDLGPADKRAQLDEIVPVEATRLTQPDSDFTGAVEAARRWLHDKSNGLLLDVRRAREAGVRPLPLHAEPAPPEDAAHPSTHGDTPAPDNRFTFQVNPDRFDESATPTEEKDPDRLDRWKRKLLDLSLFNRLLNFKDTQRTLRVMCPEPSALEDTLAQGAELQLQSRGRLPESLAQIAADSNRTPEQQADLDRFLTEELRHGRAYVDHPPAEADKRLLNLYREARSSLEETGSNLLNLALGSLTWFESASATTPRSAPLLLMPLRLTRVRAEQTYRIAFSEEPPRTNAALLEMLRVDFGLDEPSLRELPEDDTGVDVNQVLRRFQHVVKDMPRWAVEPSVGLGLFSFSKFLMWLDLEERSDDLRRSPLVRWLLDRDPDALDRSPFPDPATLDDHPPDGTPLCTRDADSSQLAAVAAATAGRTFVLEGPPGSGKSQTITNLIADALGQGQRVLFVAEKQAALSVVRRRLEQDGLGPFVFELHSNKARKIEALAQLREALELGRKRKPSGWDRSCEELHDQRNALSAYADQLHAPRATGESLRQGIGALAKLRDVPPITLPDVNPAEADEAQLAALRAAADALDAAIQWTGPPAEHPLRGIGVAEMSLDTPRLATAAIDQLLSRIQSLRSAIAPAAEALGLPTNPAEPLPHRWLSVLANLLLDPEPASPALLDEPQWSSFLQSFESAAEAARQRDADEAALLARYRPSLLELDPAPLRQAIDAAERAFFLLRFFKRRGARKPLLAHATHPDTDAAALRQDLDKLANARSRTLQLRDDPLAPLFGRAWNAGRPDWPKLQTQVDWVTRFRQQLATAPPPIQHDPASTQRLRDAALQANERFAAGSPKRQTLEALKTALEEHDQAIAGLRDALDVTWNEADAPAPFDPLQDDGGPSLTRLETIATRYRDHLAKLNDWTQWSRARADAASVGLDRIAQAALSPQAPASARASFERAFAGPWVEQAVAQSDAVRGFHAPRHDAAVDRFQQDDAALIDKAKAMLISRLSKHVHETVAKAEREAPDEITLLRRELEKRRQHVPIRKMVERLPTLLPGLKPCFLMSPLSVAQYLDPATPPFDLVVFDEASQIPAWDAVGAVARGAAVVVVGDSKQLPPTSFFARLGGDEDAALPGDEDTELESILQECVASGVPARRLEWHYRSQHESLIAFSNHHYYDNRLLTFPSADQDPTRLGVSLVKVPGAVYDRGKSQTNPVEARAVADEVLRILSDSPERTSPPPTVGVVTFNQAQQQLIEELLDEDRRSRPELDRFFDHELEPVFVKNLENVQGDERDVILFSVGYGPDADGRVSMNFGPLNQDGGERRLNVAVTRARQRVAVFTGLDPEQIDLDRTRATGVAHFKRFLEYARRGPEALPAPANPAAQPANQPDALKNLLRTHLEAHGHAVDENVGCSGYRVDLAVRRPDDPSHYALGVTLDGAAYHAADTARDRDRLRHAVLLRLGWNLHRVWSADWLYDPEGCLKRLDAALQQALAKPAD